MLTPEDLKTFAGPAKTLLENLRQFDLQVKKFHEHPQNNNRLPETLSGLLGLTASHLKTILEFPSSQATKTDALLNDMEKKAALYIGLPYALEKILPLLENFKQLEQKPPHPENYTSMTEIIVRNIKALQEPLDDLRKNQR